MKRTSEEFTEEVLNRLEMEHGGPREKFDHLLQRIANAYPTEQHITPHEMDELFHGGAEGGVDEDIAEAYPILNQVALFGELEAEDEDDYDEDDDDDDEDEEEEEDEDDVD